MRRPPPRPSFSDQTPQQPQTNASSGPSAPAPRPQGADSPAPQGGASTQARQPSNQPSRAPASTTTPKTPVSATSSQPQPPAQWSVINQKARSSLVNIRCVRRATTTQGVLVSSISGSGVFIDPRGVILTNAHIAYPLALSGTPEFGDVRCEVRSGAPARFLGEASLLFLPLAWARENSGITTARETYLSTGEYDYALLRLKSAAPDADLATRTAAPWLPTIPQKGQEVLVAAYPVEFYSPEIIERALYPVSTIANVAERYAFSSNPSVAATFSLPGVILAQKGASGGGVFLENGALTGIITTGGVSATSTGDRVLYALSLLSIDMSLRKATGMGLQALLAGDLDAREEWFREGVLPRVRQALLH
ncbi:MAG: hypothetical protein KatS3mg099_194 [Candidatus Parcubacteria bacterium]|nr:MAG: hypothetical protein KatS3mg099_194 [Candidatus Parcubacteria bacterium]